MNKKMTFLLVLLVMVFSSHGFIPGTPPRSTRITIPNAPLSRGQDPSTQGIQLANHENQSPRLPLIPRQRVDYQQYLGSQLWLQDKRETIQSLLNLHPLFINNPNNHQEIINILIPGFNSFFSHFQSDYERILIALRYPQTINREEASRYHDALFLYQENLLNMAWIFQLRGFDQNYLVNMVNIIHTQLDFLEALLELL